MLLHINAEYKKAEVCLETISESVGQDWREMAQQLRMLAALS